MDTLNSTVLMVTWGRQCGPVVEHLLSMHEALPGFHPSTAEQNQKHPDKPTNPKRTTRFKTNTDPTVFSLWRHRVATVENNTCLSGPRPLLKMRYLAFLPLCACVRACRVCLGKDP